jgi:hypothetical protein
MELTEIMLFSATFEILTHLELFEFTVCKGTVTKVKTWLKGGKVVQGIIRSRTSDGKFLIFITINPLLREKICPENDSMYAEIC